MYNLTIEPSQALQRQFPISSLTTSNKTFEYGHLEFRREEYEQACVYYSIIHVLKYFPIAFLIYLIGLCSYRLFISPLRTIPGPVFARLSIVWQLWHEMGNKYGLSISETHKKYGPFVRISHEEVSVCHPEAISNILLKPLDKHNWYKIFAMPDSSWPNQMNQTSAKKFAITQKKIAKGYMLSNVLKAEADFDETIRRFENCIDSLAEAGEPIQLDAWFTYFAFDLVGQATFSKPFGFLEQGQDVKNCIATSHALIPYLTVMAHFPQYHDFLMLNPLTKWLNFQPMKHVMDTTTRAVIEREQSLVSGSDMMEHWKSQKAGDPLTRRELLATANANVAAGADTVGTQMQSFVYLMLRHPECLRRLRTELDEALLKNKISSPVSYNASQGLQYFQACLKEVYRLHPTSFSSIPRVAPKEGVRIGDHIFPYGTVVSVNPWAIHRDPLIWGKDASIFKPDRWLENDGRARERNLISFGAGYMQCPGKQLAHVQLSKLLSTLVLDYHLELADANKEWRIAKASFVARPYGWAVKAKRRNT